MKTATNFLLLSQMLGAAFNDFEGNSKASEKTLSRKNERNRYGTRKMFEGDKTKTSQKLVDCKDKMDKPTGVMIVNERKTQRNDKCPCGSGKKFKHCHLS